MSKKNLTILRPFWKLINSIVKKNVISEQEADYIKQAGKGATFRQEQTGYEQTGQT